MLADDVERHDDRLAHERGASAPHKRPYLVIACNVIRILKKIEVKFNIEVCVDLDKKSFNELISFITSCKLQQWQAYSFSSLFILDFAT